MITFIPENTYSACAEVLDNVRLVNQAYEAYLIYNCTLHPLYGYQRHPAVLMWRPFELFHEQLANYGYAICREVMRRGNRDVSDLLKWFMKRTNSAAFAPRFMDDTRVVNSHRLALLAKKFKHYSQYWQLDHQPVQAYVWPVRHVKKTWIFLDHEYYRIYESLPSPGDAVEIIGETGLGKTFIVPSRKGAV